MSILHSKILGRGFPFLILHGFLGSGDNWKTLGSQYAETGFEVHLIDQRNHGRSFHSDAFNYDLLSEDLKAYMAYHGLAEAIVMGHSMGGKTAMQFACSHPERTKKLIVADIAPKYYPAHHQQILEGLESLDFDQIVSRGEADTLLSKKIKDFGTRQFLLKSLYWVDKTQMGFRFNLPVLAQKMEEIGENIPTNAIYRGPSLFIRGDRSEYVTLQDMAEIKRHFPSAILETVYGAGHWLHAENPEQFFNKTLAFIKS